MLDEGVDEDEELVDEATVEMPMDELFEEEVVVMSI